MARKAYSNTSVGIAKSREEISDILVRWGVTGIQWEDEFELGYAQLRFKWRRESDEGEEGEEGEPIVARFRVTVESDEELKKEAIDKRNNQFSEKKFERIKADRGKREHRLLLNLLKNMFESIEEGIIPAEALLLPWIEDVSGMTVYEKIEPNIGMLSGSTLKKSLSE